MQRINGHGHLLPYPKQIPQFMRDKKLFWINPERTLMCQGDWTRPITDKSFFLEEKLEWMEESGIQHEVILNLSQLYANGLPRDLASDTIRFQNDFNASVQESHGQRFTCGFVVQPRHLHDALEEMQRCVEDLGLRLLCLPTHFADQDGQWKSTADEDVDEIWKLADHYDLAVEIHPYDAPKIIHLEDRYWRFHLVWMCAMTADHFHIFTLRNLPRRFPRVRTCFAHGNQFGQINLGRRVQGYDGRPDLFDDTTHPSDNHRSNNVYFDTLVHDVPAFRMLVERQGVPQIVAGLDDPYPLGEMKGVADGYPGKLLDDAKAAGVITQVEWEDIWNGNVLRWLGWNPLKQ